MNDGPVLMYVKDGVLYPVAFSEENYRMLEIFLSALGTLKVVNKPMGNVVDLMEDIRNDKKANTH